MMGMFDSECEADVLRERAGYGRHETPGALAIARAIGIPVRKANVRLAGQGGCLVKIHGRFQIFVRQNLEPSYMHWVVAHELGELRLSEIGYEEHDAEQYADAIAASLLMPRRSFHAAATEHGTNLRALARDYFVSQTAAAMRLAETEVVEAVVVVTKSRLLVRGPEEYVLPNEQTLRTQRIPGLKRVALTDSRRRFALIADGRVA